MENLKCQFSKCVKNSRLISNTKAYIANLKITARTYSRISQNYIYSLNDEVKLVSL